METLRYIYIYNQLWEMVAKIEDMKSIPSRIEVLSKIEVYSTLKYSGNIYIYIMFFVSTPDFDGS